MSGSMRRLLDALLTDDPPQRARVSQALLAVALTLAGVVVMHYFVWLGIAPRRGVAAWSLLSLGGVTAACVAIRSGWTRRFEDPSLTVAQMVCAITSGAIAYALAGPGRGGVFPIVVVVLMFGMFVPTPRPMAWVSAYAVALFGATMALMAWRRPAVYGPAVEFGHFLMIATVVPAVGLLTARLARLRLRARQQRADLTAALARIRDLATRDELTGLINRRHLQELMEQEHQRCIRSGHTFCLAALEIDGFDAAAARLGEFGRDELLRGVAVEALRFVRVADVLAYWGGERFVLLMSDTRASLARAGLDRLRDRVAESRVAAREPGLRVTLSAGLAEHHAGETVAQTLARAEGGLREIGAAEHNRVVVA